MTDRIVQREEVRALLHVCENRNTSVAVRDGLVAELCRTWLAVQDAPLGTVEVMDERTSGYQVNAVECDHLEIGQRVRIVQDPTP